MDNIKLRQWRSHYITLMDSLVDVQAELTTAYDRIAALERRVNELEQEKQDGIAGS